MSELEAFSTSILTTKSPEQSASIVNEGLKQTNVLVSELVAFFDGYINVLQKQNHDLKNLASTQGNKITSVVNSGPEFGLITKVWDNYFSSIQSQIQSNDQKVRFLKLEVLSPLSNLLKNDIKHSELMINNQELTELATQNPIDEYQWSSKSLQILTNFGNFKKSEKELIMNNFLSLFNFESSVHSKNLKNSEASLNYTLNGFNLDNEMNQYLNVLLNSNPPKLEGKRKSSSRAVSSSTMNSSYKEKPKKADKRQSRLFGSSGLESAPPPASSNSQGDRKKLRSRVGSIFGRRKKKTGTSNGDLDSIYSTQTANSNVTNLTNLTHLKEEEPVVHNNNNNNGDLSKSAVPAEIPNNQPSEPSNYNPNRELPILPDHNVPLSPNVVKYSDDSEGELTEPNNEVSPQNPEPFTAKNLDGLPPQPHYLDVNKSRFTQYSFESGDDTKFTASPSFQQQGQFPSHDQTHELPDPIVDDERDERDDVGELPSGFGGNESLPSTSPSSEYPPSSSGSKSLSGPPPSIGGSAPAPPPARRVAHHEKRSEIHSQMFHSLPPTSSMVEPPHPKLSTQTTGSSLMTKGGDLFNHQDLVHNLIPGLNLSNSQVINVNFKQDALQKASIIGEIAFNYQGTNTNDLIIHLPNKFTKTISNHQFLTQLNEESFKVNPTPILNQTLGGIKYMDQNLKLNQIPILVHSIWKYEEHQASLMIKLQLNPNFKSSITLNGLIVSVALKTDVETTSASSRPTGVFNMEKNRIIWRYSNAITLDEESPEERLIARFITKGLANEDDNGIQLKFTISNHLNGGVSCNDQEVHMISNLIAGNYSSQS